MQPMTTEDWEQYWQRIEQDYGPEGVFWDDPSDVDSADDLRRLLPYVDPALPLLDVGCGHGRQSRFFARHFDQVIGVDISESAIRIAASENADVGNLQFRVFDGLGDEESLALHREFGDMNIYMRGVLHMIRWHDRARFVDNLGAILGERGVLYQIELPAASILYLRDLPEDVFASIPRITRRVGFNNNDRRLFYPEDKWTVIAEGEGVYLSTKTIPGRPAKQMPANYLILSMKHVLAQ